VDTSSFSDVAIEDNRVLASGLFRSSFSFAGQTLFSEEQPGVFGVDGS